MNKTCYVKGCRSHTTSKNLCIKHYSRWYKYGDTSFVKQIKGDDLKRFWSKVNKVGNNECWEWTRGFDSCGYGVFYSVANPYMRAHRWSYEQFIGPIKKGKNILHKCDNPPCVNPAHLFMGSQRDNIIDMERKGRAIHPKGIANGMSKFTPAIIADIRKRFVDGSRWKPGNTIQLAEQYGVWPSTIRSIAIGKTWK